MERIDKNNYQAFILDYYEGSLSAERQAELILFIENHPGLREEFESFDPVRLAPDDAVAFPGKASLYKGVTEANVQDYLVARLEGDLSAADTAALESFLDKNPAYRKDESLYQRTRLEPDLSVVFPGKRELKKPVPIGSLRVVRYLYYAAAASVALLLGVYFLNSGNTDRLATIQKPAYTPAEQPDPQATGTDTTGTGRATDQKELQTTPESPTKDVPVHPAPQPRRSPVDELPDRENVAYSSPKEQIRNDAQPADRQPSTEEAIGSTPYVADVSPDLIREKLAGEIGADPAAFDGNRFEAFLDRVTDPDSSLSVDDLKKPVFEPAPEQASPATARKQNATPVLNALAWGMSKVSDDVRLRKQYDDQGELIAYQFEAGKLKFGKSDGK